MRFSRSIGVAVLALALIASACGNGDEDEEALPVESTVTIPPSSETTTSRPVIPEPEPDPEENEEEEDPETGGITTTTTTTVPPGDGTGPPPPPANLTCLAGANEGEVTLEWDAPADPSNVAAVRLYVSEDGGPFITNRNLDLSNVDQTRSGGSRWGATVLDVPANLPIRLAATTFNALGQESGWYVITGMYRGPGQPCTADATVVTTTTTPPDPTCTAGCE